MHSDWDLVKLGLPAYVFTEEQVAAKGQHYIVHFSSRSSTDSIYTDAIDVHALVEDVDPDLIYGKKNADWAWTKTDHCQWTEPRGITDPRCDEECAGVPRGYPEPKDTESGYAPCHQHRAVAQP